MGKERGKEREWHDLPKQSWLWLRVLSKIPGTLGIKHFSLSWEETQGKMTAQ